MVVTKGVPVDSAALLERMNSIIKDYNIKYLIANLHLNDDDVSRVLDSLNEEISDEYNEEELVKLKQDMEKFTSEETIELMNGGLQNTMKVLALGARMDLIGQESYDVTYIYGITLQNLTELWVSIGRELIKARKSNPQDVGEIKDKMKEVISILVSANQLARQEVVHYFGKVGANFDPEQYQLPPIMKICETQCEFMNDLRDAGLNEEAEALRSANMKWAYVNDPEIEELVHTLKSQLKKETDQPEKTQIRTYLSETFQQKKSYKGLMITVLVCLVCLVIGVICGFLAGKYLTAAKSDSSISIA